MIVTELADKVLYFEDVIEDVESLVGDIEWASNAAIPGWTPWSSGDSDHVYGDLKEIRKYQLGTIEDEVESRISSKIIETLCSLMVDCIQVYGDHYKISDIEIKYAQKAVNHKKTIFGINKYLEGVGMGPHIDWNEKNNYVEYVLVIYLNDDYDGGAIRFVEPEVDITVKPKAGSVLMFPANMPYRHESLVAKNGRKILITHHWRGGAQMRRVKHLVEMLRGIKND